MFTEAAHPAGDPRRHPLHLGALVALFARVAAWVLLTTAVIGFQIRVVGQAPMAARFAGFSQNGTIWFYAALRRRSPASPACSKSPARSAS